MKHVALEDGEEVCMRYFVEGLLEVQGQDARRGACHFCMRYCLPLVELLLPQKWYSLAPHSVDRQ